MALWLEQVTHVSSVTLKCTGCLMMAECSVGQMRVASSAARGISTSTARFVFALSSSTGCFCSVAWLLLSLLRLSFHLTLLETQVHQRKLPSLFSRMSLLLEWSCCWRTYLLNCWIQSSLTTCIGVLFSASCGSHTLSVSGRCFPIQRPHSFWVQSEQSPWINSHFCRFDVFWFVKESLTVTSLMAESFRLQSFA